MQNTSVYRDPNRGFRMFLRTEIVPNGPWVPNIDDLILDPSQGFFIVVESDITTGNSVLIPWSPPTNNQDDADGKLIGFGPGYVSESYRIFLDTSVTPHQLTPDFRLHAYGSEASYYKVFRGTDISEQFGVVVSRMYDSANNFLGDSIPMERVNPSDDVSTIKTLSPGYTTIQMQNGELCTVVMYAANGTQISQAQLVVVNSKAVRRSDASKRYIEAIYLDSPFVSSADPKVIEFPLNVTVESLPLTAVVRYSDGSTSRHSITGGQFELMGLRDYIATEVGQQFPMLLNYRLANDEVSYNMVPNINNTLVETYYARSITADGAYEIKIYGYPVWISASVGYRMEYWMYNMDRQAYYNVTPYIELATNSAPFDPKAYGTVQTFTVALDINRVDGRFRPYRAVQIMRVALLNHGDGQNPNWEIIHTPNQVNGYGRDLALRPVMQSVNNWTINLRAGEPNVERWLERYYYNVQPLFNIEMEPEAPRPTHFILQFRNNAYEYPISYYSETLTVNNDLQHGELLYIRWIKRTSDTDLQLATTAVPISLM